jgi:hypothetical protein
MKNGEEMMDSGKNGAGRRVVVSNGARAFWCSAEQRSSSDARDIN